MLRIMQVTELGPLNDTIETMVLALLVEIERMIMYETDEQFKFIKIFVRSITVREYLMTYIIDDLSKKQHIPSLEWYQAWCKKHMNPKVLGILINLIHDQLGKYYKTAQQMKHH